MRGREEGCEEVRERSARALKNSISPASLSPCLPLSLTCRLIITQQPRGDCFCSVRSRVYSLSHSGVAWRSGGKGNMRARSQFAILWSYQMSRRKEGGREAEGEGAAISIGRAASNQSARLPRTARTATGHGPRRTNGGRGTVAIGFVIISQFVSAAREKLELCIGILYAVS